MAEAVKHKASPVMVIVAFAIVYIVWGSTYFFIAVAIRHFPPMIFGFIGVTLMFGEKIVEAITATGYSNEILGLIIILIATISWAGGSLYSKHKSTGSSTVNTAWQMSVAG